MNMQKKCTQSIQVLAWTSEYGPYQVVKAQFEKSNCTSAFANMTKGKRDIHNTICMQMYTHLNIVQHGHSTVTAWSSTTKILELDTAIISPLTIATVEKGVLSHTS